MIENPQKEEIIAIDMQSEKSINLREDSESDSIMMVQKDGGAN